MADTPIPQQEGLSQKDLDKMKPTEQKYKKNWNGQSSSDRTLQKYLGVPAQINNLRNLLKDCFVNYDKERAEMDSTDEYGTDKCIRDFSNDLASALVKIIQCQKVNVTTTLTMTDTVVGTLITAGAVFTQTAPGVGTGTGTATPNQVNIV